MSSRLRAWFAVVLFSCFSQSAFAVQAPQPDFDGEYLVWPQIDAKAINVHKVDGTFIESLAGNATQWAVPESGQYFLVGTDEGDWTGWARSEPVSAILGSPPPSTNFGLVGLAVDVYSSSSIELFWNSLAETTSTGETTPIVKVRISREGVEDAYSYGSSFYETGLSVGTNYTYTLTPFDTAGNEGASASLSLLTRGSKVTTTRPPVPNIDEDAKPLPPIGLRADVYSSSSVELFWNHAADYNSLAVTYVIYQDGQIIEVFRDGSSQYITGLSAGTMYEFSVTALANALVESDPQTIQVTTNGRASANTPPHSITETQSPSEISISGNTISWLADGWYEVQSATTFESVCEGGNSCDVNPGAYNVINHTTDMRWEQVVVGQADNPVVNEPVTDNNEDDNAQAEFTPIDLPVVADDLVTTLAGYQLDNLAGVVDDLAFIIGQQTTMVWPNDDYYQVQNSEELPFILNSGFRPQNFDTVCEGGSDCKILPGAYVVINHSADERTRLEVPYVDPADQATAIKLANGSYTNQHPLFLDNTFDLKRFQYECENAGTMIMEFGGGTIVNTAGADNGGVNRYNYIFDQCNMTVRDGLLPDDNYLINGTLGISYIQSFDFISDFDFDGLSIVGDSGLAYSADGQVRDVDGYDFLYIRSTNITDYTKKTIGGEVVEAITNARFDYDNSLGISMSFDGSLFSLQTGNQTVGISTDPDIFYSYRYNDPGPEKNFSGAYEIAAQDSSYIRVSANPKIDADERFLIFVDRFYINADGEQTQLFEDTYQFPFDENAAACTGKRVSRSRQLSCAAFYRRTTDSRQSLSAP